MRLLCRLHRHRARTWLLWALGTAVLCATSVSLLDPALLPFAVDPELMALLVDSTVAFALLSLRTGLPALRRSAALRTMRAVASAHLVAVRYLG